MMVSWCSTYRIHQTWVAWLNEDMNCPNRTDHYLIQLTWMVLGIISALGGGESDIDMDDLILKFSIGESDKGKEKSYADSLTIDEYSAHALASWGARVGMDPQQLKLAVKDILTKKETLPDESELRLSE